jgi:probable rRNA maturation factor
VRTASKASNYYLLNRQRKHSIDWRGVRRFLGGVAAELGVPQAAFTVVFVTDRVMRTYNRRYRGIDKPTDVLSFGGGDGYLGDIVVSAETAFRQANRSPALTFQTNIRRLVLHGLLHLCGYDHATDQGEMRAIERRFRRRFGC